MGANIKAEDKEGFTPLLIAARYGSYKAVRVLVNEFGADVNANKRDGQTPLHAAALNNHDHEVFRILASPGQTSKRRITKAGPLSTSPHCATDAK